WAASDKPLVTGNDHVRFGTRSPVYYERQEVELVARLGEDVTPPRPDSPAGARVFRVKDGKEEDVALVPLERREGQPRLLEGRLRDLPGGDYRVELVIPDLADKLLGPTGPDGQTTKLQAPFTVAAPETSEMIELATNMPLLIELAAKSGGQVFGPENAAELAELLKEQAATRIIPVE